MKQEEAAATKGKKAAAVKKASTVKKATTVKEEPAVKASNAKGNTAKGSVKDEKKDDPDAAKKGKKTDAAKTAKPKPQYDMPGQTQPTPSSGEPLAKFYLSLLKQRPDSEMANKWCVILSAHLLHLVCSKILHGPTVCSLCIRALGIKSMSHAQYGTWLDANDALRRAYSDCCEWPDNMTV